MSVRRLKTMAEVNAVPRATQKGQMRTVVEDRIAYKQDRTRKESAFRAAVWKRDESKCRLCGKRVKRTADSTEKGHVHHLRGRNVAPEDRYNPARAILLCALCHLKHHAGEVKAKP